MLQSRTEPWRRLLVYNTLRVLPSAWASTSAENFSLLPRLSTSGLGSGRLVSECTVFNGNQPAVAHRDGFTVYLPATFSYKAVDATMVFLDTREVAGVQVTIPRKHREKQRKPFFKEVGSKFFHDKTPWCSTSSSSWKMRGPDREVVPEGETNSGQEGEKIYCPEYEPKTPFRSEIAAKKSGISWRLRGPTSRQ
ncbi:hypothetical protein FN846DRAFT_978355 [Sphaerosporella brunnea]|uniref:Uncharacterized protein n=1 Tax=Sphaerosporella brunnea TaxID=1250544 RepID=A0A5J5EF62_9PEZI|nr:hypothetical protein FN846DRAFT_978355 [Sphaerosporella brunnea]